MKAKNICIRCGGHLVAEAVGHYGTLFYIKRDGSIGHKIKSVTYEGTGDWMYYCSDCGKTL